ERARACTVFPSATSRSTSWPPMNPDPPVTKAVSVIEGDVSLAFMRSVLITGASTGIGRASALHLDAAGWRVFAGVRKEDDAASLREAGSEGVLPPIPNPDPLA